MAHEDMVTAWLKDAYSMELGLVPILENHAKDAKENPQMQQRIQQHAEETKRHAEMVKQCLDQMGEKPSSLKAAVGGMMGTMQSVATGPFKDEMVKNALSDFAAENFEIACYRALSLAAEQVGDTQTSRICEEILRDEMNMAKFLEQNLPMAVQEALMMRQREHGMHESTH